MSKNKNEIRYVGINFFGLLGIVFITLKLTGYINWSWWWVLAPLWMPISVFVSLLAFLFIIVFVYEWIKDKN
jgi:hypothetical protein